MCVRVCVHARVCVCVSDELSVVHGAYLPCCHLFMFNICFLNGWSASVQIMSCMRELLRKYAIELESKKDAGGLGHAMVPAPAFRASSFVLPIRVWPASLSV